jgi:hypothetical protein
MHEIRHSRCYHAHSSVSDHRLGQFAPTSSGTYRNPHGRECLRYSVWNDRRTSHDDRGRAIRGRGCLNYYLCFLPMKNDCGGSGVLAHLGAICATAASIGIIPSLDVSTKTGQAQIGGRPVI